MPSQNRNEEKKSRILQQTVLEFCSATTAHGLGRVASSTSRFARFLWFILFLLAFAYTWSSIYELLEQYYMYEVKVDIISIREKAMQFPAVTICNMNRFKKSKMQGSTLENITEKIIQRNVAMSAGLDFSQWMWITQTELVKEHRQFNSSVLSSFGHQAKDFIVTCSSPGSSFEETCSVRNFTRSYSPVYGNCFTFNGADRQRDITVKAPGPDFGFLAVLNTESDEYIPDALMSGEGVVVDIHEPDVKSALLKENSGIRLAPGTTVSIALKARNDTRLPLPYGGQDCRQSNIPGEAYSEKFCMEKCNDEAFSRECGCLVSNTETDLLPCDILNKTQEVCIGNVVKNYSGEGIFEVCRKQCPPACSKQIFLPTISSVQWPSKVFHPLLKKMVQNLNHSAVNVMGDFEKTRENLLRVEIYFETMVKETMEQKEAYPHVKLISDIGGQLGLCAGLSALTFVEFFAFGYALLRAFLWPIKKRVQDRREGEAETTARDAGPVAGPADK